VQASIFAHTYDNGLILVAQPMPWLESAAFTLLVPGGCAYDPPQRLGLASFVGDMVLRGAGSRDSRQFVNDLDNLGVSRGEQVTEEHTSYGGATLAAHLGPTLAIYSDVVQRPHFPEDQFDNARATMFQELASLEDDLPLRAHLELRKRHYPDPWGRAAQGDEAGIAATTLSEVRGHFQTHYRPNGAILAVAGNVDWAALREQVGELFGMWKPREVRPLVETPPRGKVAHVPHDSQQTQITLAFSTIPFSHPQYYDCAASVSILGGSMSSRLFTEVREKRGLCYSVSAGLHVLKDRASVICYAGTGPARAQETLDVTWAETLKLGQGIQEYELSRVQARYRSQLIMQQESIYSRSASLAYDWYHLGRARALDEVQARLNSLTCAGINAFLAEHPPRDFTLVTLGSRPLETPHGVS